MQRSSTTSDPTATTSTAEELFLAGANARLRPGDRIPSFLLPDRDGAARWFIQYCRGYGLLLVLDPSDAEIEAIEASAPEHAAAELECIGIMRAVPSSPEFRILIDSANKVGPALRQMSGLPDRGPAAFLLDHNQRIVAMTSAGSFADWAKETWLQVRDPVGTLTLGSAAPVLIIPNVLSPEMCRALIERWHTHGHEAGEVISIVEGEQVHRVYDELKRRLDHSLEDPAVLKPLLALIARRLAPEMTKAFHFRDFRFDQVWITCYDSERGDYFRRHRDNQTPSTAGRRFALTINLNSDEYDGGELLFPEYGPHKYTTPLGGAILFSCSLLHEALPVSRGRRFALLSFLRDATNRGERS